MAEKFIKGGQEAWFHDQGHWGGFFHTYNQFQIDQSSQKPRKIDVFLPRDYEVSQNSYPVIYLNDGDQVFFPSEDIKDFWDIPRILTRLYVGNQIRKVIVVAITPLNRDYEYTHAPVLHQEWGGLDDYGNYIAETLKVFIDNNYRTISDPENTLIIGESHGGLAAFYTAIKYPHSFGCVAALAPSFFVGLDTAIESCFSTISKYSFSSLEYSALWFATSQTLSDPKNRLKFYLDWGLVKEDDQYNPTTEARVTRRAREMRDLLIRYFDYQENQNLFIVEDSLEESLTEFWFNRMGHILKIFFGK